MRTLQCGGICALCLLWWVGPLTSASAQTPTIDQLVLFKSEHKLVALAEGQVVRIYHVALGKTPRGAKLCRGDNRTPEGAYFVTRRVPGSHYYLALHLSYPSDDDVVRARDLGCDLAECLVVGKASRLQLAVPAPDEVFRRLGEVAEDVCDDASSLGRTEGTTAGEILH